MAGIQTRDLVEQLTRRLAARKQIVVNGQLVISPDGDPLLQTAFNFLGWADVQPVYDSKG